MVEIYSKRLVTAVDNIFLMKMSQNTNQHAK